MLQLSNNFTISTTRDTIKTRINKHIKKLFPIHLVNSPKIYITVYIDERHKWLKFNFHNDYREGDLLLSRSYGSWMISSTSIKRYLENNNLNWGGTYYTYNDSTNTELNLYINLMNVMDLSIPKDKKWISIFAIRHVLVTNTGILCGTISKFDKYYKCKMTIKQDMLEWFKNYTTLYFEYDTITDEILIKNNNVFHYGHEVCGEISRSKHKAFSLSINELKVISEHFGMILDFDNYPKNIYLNIVKHDTLKDTFIIKDFYTKTACALKSVTCI